MLPQPCLHRRTFACFANPTGLVRHTGRTLPTSCGAAHCMIYRTYWSRANSPVSQYAVNTPRSLVHQGTWRQIKIRETHFGAFYHTEFRGLIWSHENITRERLLEPSHAFAAVRPALARQDVSPAQTVIDIHQNISSVGLWALDYYCAFLNHASGPRRPSASVSDDSRRSCASDRMDVCGPLSLRVSDESVPSMLLGISPIRTAEYRLFLRSAAQFSATPHVGLDDISEPARNPNHIAVTSLIRRGRGAARLLSCMAVDVGLLP